MAPACDDRCARKYCSRTQTPSDPLAGDTACRRKGDGGAAMRRDQMTTPALTLGVNKTGGDGRRSLRRPNQDCQTQALSTQARLHQSGVPFFWQLQGTRRATCRSPQKNAQAAEQQAAVDHIPQQSIVQDASKCKPRAPSRARRPQRKGWAAVCAALPLSLSSFFFSSRTSSQPITVL